VRLRTARLRTALGRTAQHRRPARGFTPVEQVLRAPVRPLQRHVHHQHLSSTTLQLRVAVGVRVVSASHPIRIQVVSQAQARGPAAPATTFPGVAFRHQAAPATTFPGVAFRDQVAPTVTAVVAGRPAWQLVPLIDRTNPPASSARATSAARALRSAPRPVELVHRLPTPSASGAAAYRPADARVNGTAARAGTRCAGPGAPVASGAAPLTAADVPGVVDQVVREIDRRVVAVRERRGWTA
jgi:hypothetical protein